jgi:hypothetical protein
MSSTDQPTSGAAPAGVSTITDPAVLDTHDHDHGGHPHGGGTSTVHENAPYAYSLISWGSVLAGAVIALAIGGMLSLFGLGIGASTFDPTNVRNAGEVTTGAGLWLAISTVLGMLIGGYVAARSAHNPDHHEGALHGASVWAVGFVLAFFLTGSFATNAAFSGLQAAGQAAEAATPAAVDRAAGAARRAADAATPDSAEERQTVEAAKKATSAGAFWAAFTMLASGVAAVIGGSLGAKHDERLHRPRRTNGGASSMF